MSSLVLASVPVIVWWFKNIIVKSIEERDIQFEGGEGGKCGQYNTLTDGLNLKTTLGRHWNLAYLLRQISLVLILVFLRDHPSFQLLLIHLKQISLQSFIINASPLHSTLENRVSLFNEIMFSSYLYTLQCILIQSSQESDEYLRMVLGWALLAILIVTILANLVKTGVLVYREARVRLNRRRARKYLTRMGTIDATQPKQTQQESDLVVEDLCQEDATADKSQIEAIQLDIKEEKEEFKEEPQSFKKKIIIKRVIRRIVKKKKKKVANSE
ncbi:hypothetical protein FGO68_gene12767 [Halteria grandinella]|uniref:Uncharacterized protein n=1 Tax=Halteria grandinella TaxID=5974 RepID=A0A8J8P664_HALGN|nr:hypothetical protein FGO68_gene12767 [Halteria grandinella]